jgi:hypothetical protein
VRQPERRHLFDRRKVRRCQGWARAMTATYDIAAKPSGVFASALEEAWDRQFETAGWVYRYIGDRVRWADFVVADCFELDEAMLLPRAERFFVEIKPTKDHLEAACRRAIGTDWQFGLVIVGEPGRQSDFLGRPLGFSHDWPCVNCWALACGSNEAELWPVGLEFRWFFGAERRPVRDVLGARNKDRWHEARRIIK